jgi:hypothetical protein
MRKKRAAALNKADREIDTMGFGKIATNRADAQGSNSTPRNRRFNPIDFVKI